MTYLLVVMSFMQGYLRGDWYTANAIQMPSLAACEAAGKAMVEMEKRTQYRCVAAPQS